MAKEKEVKVEEFMKVESTLPSDFDGTFRFTNYSDEEFVGVWGGKEYHFAPNSTSPMVIPEHSPLEVQHIRKKFAKNLAEREFFKSREYKTLQKQEGTSGNRTMSGIHQAGQYSSNELVELIQRCLSPLPVSRAVVTNAVKEKVEDKLTRNDDGELNTEAIDSKTSLREKALKG